MNKENTTFKPVDSQPDFVAQEEELLQYWYETGVVEEYLHRNDSSDKKFSFLDGPITANNPMGVHHAWGRTYKDLWQRWFNMRGYKERFQNGFDNQGLWVEVNVEKELGFNSKKDIEKFGIEKFVEKCKETTRRWAGIQTEQSKRLGMFMDWPNSYYTMSDENNYTIWSALKKVHQNSWLYKGHDSVAWCPRCGTAISNHEILTENYADLTHRSIFAKFPLKDKAGEYLLVWTTTPWTMPANVAVAINPNLSYVKVEQNGEIYYLAEDRLSILHQDYKILEKLKGSKLKDLPYVGPFDHLPAVKKTLGDYIHRVIEAGDLVNAEEGTGLVHIATGAGKEDFDLGKKEHLPVISPIDEAANYVEGYEDLTGRNAKDNPGLVIDDMSSRNLVYKLEDYTHRYPRCWRCGSELVWRVVEEWYIGMDELRGKIQENTKKVQWIPEFCLDRELDWLRNMGDWMISKNRYWGLALPIWECKKCGHFEVIGSYEELRDRAVEGWDKFEGHSPHRPWIDEVKIKCSKCGEKVSRVSDVGDVWLDAGIVPFSTLKYNEDRHYWKEWFPADFITESFPGQFKGWFYSLLTMSSIMENTNPIKTVLGFGTLLADDGRPMHKSSGNSIEFNEAAGKVGADAMRWVYTKHNPENNLLFGWGVISNARKSFFLILWNVYKFFIDYALLDGWTPKEIESSHILDKWLMSRFNEMLGAVDSSLGKYDPLHAAEAIDNFVGDFSTWWLRRSRDRMGPWAKDEADKSQAYSSFYFVLVNLAKILAPFTPFFADMIYRNLTQERSVHLVDWPKPGVVDQTLLEQMRLARIVVEQAHSLRKDRGLKLRQPLASLTYTYQDRLASEIEKVIADEVNVKMVNYQERSVADPEVTLDFTLTPELEAEGQARDIIRQIQDERKNLKLDRTDAVEVMLTSIPEGWSDEIARATVAKHLKLGEHFEVKPVK